MVPLSEPSNPESVKKVIEQFVSPEVTVEVVSNTGKRCYRVRLMLKGCFVEDCIYDTDVEYQDGEDELRKKCKSLEHKLRNQ